MIGPALRLAAAFKLSGNGDPLAVTRTPVIPETSPLPTPPPAAGAAAGGSRLPGCAAASQAKSDAQCPQPECHSESWPADRIVSAAGRRTLCQASIIMTIIVHGLAPAAIASCWPRRRRNGRRLGARCRVTATVTSAGGQPRTPQSAATARLPLFRPAGGSAKASGTVMVMV